ncbi:MAG TPA: long-chain fatty acid--CoA ligase [Candidatus Acidoferrales bacterium]|nr:long-chain fatty acid--CoA ligase [Candidatus Acidoferrales bacterium]
MPSPVAIHYGTRTISHVELTERVGAECQRLRSAGVQPGQRVALRCGAGPQALIGQLALLAGGALLIPLPATYTDAESAAVVERCNVEWLVTSGGYQATDRNAVQRSAALGLLSSGSSGSPKLVLISAPQFAASLDIYRRSLDLSPDDRLLTLVPLSHAFGLRFVHATLAAGGSVVLPTSLLPRAVVEQANGATLIAAGPRYIELLSDRSFPGVRAVVAGGALAAHVHAAFTGAPLWQSYGASEAGTICLNRAGFAVDGRLALGRPNPGVTVELRDTEIVVRSAAVGIGYDGDSGDSAIVEGEFRSGDLGRWQHGQLVFLGRRKLLIDTGAARVDPAEVEAVLRTHPRIRDAAVIGEGRAGAEVVTALLVVSDPLALLEVTAWCAQHLAPQKIPRRVEYRDVLPRDALGKLRRDQL